MFIDDEDTIEGNKKTKKKGNQVNSRLMSNIVRKISFLRISEVIYYIMVIILIT